MEQLLIGSVISLAKRKFLIEGEPAVRLQLKIDSGREISAIAIRKSFPVGIFSMPLIKELPITVIYYPGSQGNLEGHFEIAGWQHQTDECKGKLLGRLVNITSEGLLENLEWEEPDPNLLKENSIKANLERIYSNSSNFDDSNSRILKKKSFKKKAENNHIPENNLDKKISFRGEEYTLSELARHLGIKVSILKSRIQRDLPKERWDADKDGIFTTYFYKNKKYNSISALAEHLNVKPSVLRNRIKKGLPQSQWGKPTFKKEIIFYGRRFPSITSLAKFLNINPQTLRGRIKRGWSQESWGS